MSTDREELYEMLKKPNVKVVKGENGKTWTCWDPDTEKEKCESTDDVQYDRDFGG